MSTKSMPGSFTVPTWIRVPQWNAKKKSGLTDDTFAWTQEQFDALIEGDLDNKGKGGTNYKDIIKKHGLPDSEFDSTIGGYDTRKISYISIGDNIKTVTLTFVKQDNGQLLLVHKIAVGLGESQQQRDSGTRL